MSVQAPIVDTNVLVDIAVESRPRHAVADQLAMFFEREGIKLWVPAHGLYELHAAIRNESLTKPIELTLFPSADHPINLHVVYIDEGLLRPLPAPWSACLARSRSHLRRQCTRRKSRC